MALEGYHPIGSLLSSLLKKSLTTVDIYAVANKYNVHYNTIINIRDRRKKAPNKNILSDMIRMAISNQKQNIKNSKELLYLLEEELEKLT